MPDRKLDAFLEQIETGQMAPVTPANIQQIVVRQGNDLRRLMRVVKKLRGELTMALSLLPEPEAVRMHANLPPDQKDQALALSVLMRQRLDMMASSLQYDGMEDA